MGHIIIKCYAIIYIYTSNYVLFASKHFHEPGTEAMFADLGHFNVRAVQVSNKSSIMLSSVL